MQSHNADGSTEVARYIREHLQQIQNDWEKSVRADLKELAKLDRGALIDHLPEVLNGLADWVDGQTARAESAFQAMADGHALQRLGFGIELATVNIEYAKLRHVLMKHLIKLPGTDEVRSQNFAVMDGLDRAIYMSVRRYTEHRDFLRDRFIGILGHDLRGPLTAVTTASQTLMRAVPPADANRRHVETIVRAADRMNRMIVDVLDFARSHLGGGIPVVPEECDMGEICRSAVEEARAAHPGRVIEVTTQGDLLGTFDRDRTLQALGNLISNAIQYGEDPIRVSALEAPDRHSLITCVTNRGQAIPEAMLRKLFNPFVRVGEGKGSLGLGLFITAQIVRMHGGTHHVVSTPEETAFTLKWPRASRQDVADRP